MIRKAFRMRINAGAKKSTNAAIVRSGGNSKRRSSTTAC